MNVLTAEGLTLEPQTAAHAEPMFETLGDPALYEYENEPPPSLEWLRDRYRKLESRHSPDGSELWLNWVVRLADSRLIGFVQATVYAAGHSYLAYVLSSAQWSRGFARRFVEATIAELASEYDVHTLWALFKGGNFRSRRLLDRLAFRLAMPAELAQHAVEPDELLMTRAARGLAGSA